MRIFLVMHPAGNMAVPDSMTWYRNLYEPLLDLGHEVFYFRLDQFVSENKLIFRSQDYRKKLSIKLGDTFCHEYRKKPFDLFFSYLTSYDITAECLQIIKQTGVPMINFSCNNTHQFYLVESISKYFDYNLHSEKSTAPKFTNAGVQGYWFQMGANPKYYKPLGLDFKYDVSFIGSNYAKRAGYINHLLTGGLNVKCFGGGWVKPRGMTRLKKEVKTQIKILGLLLKANSAKKFDLATYIRDYELTEYLRSKYSEYFNVPVTDDEMIQIFNQSKINLGFLEVYGYDNIASSGLQQHLHLREFEVPMSGGLYITNYSDELTEFFEPDKEVVVFRNEYELLDKVKFFLSNPSAADKIRLAGLKRALASHTCEIRLRTMFKILFSN